MKFPLIQVTDNYQSASNNTILMNLVTQVALIK
jgi:hypothetical protein